MQHQCHRGGHTSTKTVCHLTYKWRNRLPNISGIRTTGLFYHTNVPPLPISEERKIRMKTTFFSILHRFIIMTHYNIIQLDIVYLLHEVYYVLLSLYLIYNMQYITMQLQWLLSAIQGVFNTYILC